MDTKQIASGTQERMGKAIEALESSLAVLRTGRANPGILKKVVVDYHGTPMPVDQLANITTPDPRTLNIQPWDRSALPAIERAIRDSDLGLNPNNKGDTIFITLPALTEERRRDLVKNARSYAEDAKVAVRNIRKGSLDDLKKVEGVGEDDLKRGETEVQKVTDEYIRRVDEVTARKEQDILG
ncbi:MAG: ribosome recycling factor [Deinococcus sp.]